MRVHMFFVEKYKLRRCVVYVTSLQHAWALLYNSDNTPFIIGVMLCDAEGRSSSSGPRWSIGLQPAYPGYRLLLCNSVCKPLIHIRHVGTGLSVKLYSHGINEGGDDYLTGHTHTRRKPNGRFLV